MKTLGPRQLLIIIVIVIILIDSIPQLIIIGHILKIHNIIYLSMKMSRVQLTLIKKVLYLI